MSERSLLYLIAGFLGVNSVLAMFATHQVIPGGDSVVYLLGGVLIVASLIGISCAYGGDQQ
ncbi:MAG: hypothetical protein ACYC4U_10260 [Pirellulaceae bacterium]